MSDVKNLLAGVFSGPGFNEFRRYCFNGKANEKTIGVVLATQNSTYLNFALNEGDFTRLLEAEDGGRVDEAWVVFARVDVNKRAFKSAIPARELRELIQRCGLEARPGRYGPFIVLPAGLAPPDDNAPF
jgi:hypothetical protein